MSGLLTKEVIKYGGAGVAAVIMSWMLFQTIEAHDERTIQQAAEQQKFLIDTATAFQSFTDELKNIGEKWEKTTEVQRQLTESVRLLEQSIRLQYRPAVQAPVGTPPPVKETQ